MNEIVKLLLVIKNSLIASKLFCIYTYLTFTPCFRILTILYVEGFITTFIHYKHKKTIKIIFTKLIKKKNFYIFNILTIFNKKAFPFQIKYQDLIFFHSSIDLLILSTSYGIISHYEALRYKIGGKVICYLR